MGIKDHLLAKLGYLGTVAVAIRTVVGLLGDLDFIVGEAKQPKWTRPVIDLILAPPSYLILPILFLSVAAIWWDYRNGPVRISSMTPLTIAIFFSLAFVCAWGYYFWDKNQGPIVWIDDENSPLSFTRSGDEPPWVYAFQIKGKSRSSDPIVPVEAFVKSNVDGRKLPLAFGEGALVPVSQRVVAPDGTFILIAVLPSADPKFSGGLPATVFHNQFASFTITFKYEGGAPIERRFSKVEVDRLIEQGTHRMEASRPPGPSLIPKKPHITAKHQTENLAAIETLRNWLNSSVYKVFRTGDSLSANLQLENFAGLRELKSALDNYRNTEIAAFGVESDNFERQFEFVPEIVSRLRTH
jgi:hypothetical protein